jgi:electron transfer flavoprotein beta subunit
LEKKPMKIVVCVKQICHTYTRTGKDPDAHFIAAEDRIHRINPYDEAATELALCAKELVGHVEIIILTLGPLTAEAELRRCLAMGADSLVQIDGSETLDPWGKSAILARAVKELSPGLVLCGKESLDRQSGQVGTFLAHRLQLPFLSSITKLELGKEKGLLRAERKAARGTREVVECSLPAVLSVDLGDKRPRLPTYDAKRRAASAPIKRLPVREPPNESKVLTRGVSPPRPRPKRVLEPDSRLAAAERIEQLLEGSRAAKKGLILRGDVDSQVEGIISFLKEHDLLRSEE